jgi:hypothetical protein
MINDIAQEILHDLFSSLEALETQSGAILQFLKDKGIASEEELAFHFERAGNASSVRWRAARVRIDHLLSSAIEAAQKVPKADQQKSSENQTQSPAETAGSSETKPEEKSEVTEKSAARDKPEREKEQQDDSAENRRNRENKEIVKGSKTATNRVGGEEVSGKKIA